VTAPDSPAPLTPVETIRKALLGYRVMAWATGIWLIALCYEMVLKYGFNNDSLSWIAIVHGWVYFVYLLFTANLAVKVRWPIGKTAGDGGSLIASKRQLIRHAEKITRGSTAA